MLKKNIPNILTSFNLLSGCLAAYFAYNHFFSACLVFCLLGIIFDFLDGFFAKLLNVESEIGKYLDSLSDIITSGFVPGIIMYQLFFLSGVKEFNFVYNINSFNIIFSIAPLALIGFLITLGSAFRLAKFNTIDSVTDHFEGLPTPANSIFIVSIPSLINNEIFINLKPFILNPVSLIIITFSSIFLMNINWKLFKIRFYRDFNLLIYPILLFIFSIILFLLLKQGAFALIIIFYLLLSLVKNIISNN